MFIKLNAACPPRPLSVEEGLLGGEGCAARVSLGPVLGHVVALGMVLAGLAGMLIDWSKLSGAAFLLSLLLVVPAHEAVHVVVAKALGAGRASVKPLVYWKVVVAGVAVSFSNPLSLARWSLVALAPLLTLSPIFLALSRLEGALGSLFSASFLVNTAGSSGDLAFLLLAASAGPRARILDDGDAVRVLGASPKPWAVLLLEGVYAFVAALLVLGVALLTAASALGRSLDVAGVALVEYTRSGSGLSIRTGPGVPLAALAATLAFLLVRGRGRARRIMSTLEAGCRP
jgi:hypothetical protein